MEKVILTIFTDPMMGLSYECEPIFDRFKNEYGDGLEIRYVMAGLVRDVSDFMMPEELSYPPEEGIRRYCKRLAGIYKSEEAIGGLPINMEGFHLFDTEHRSSYPLCIAYEAAKLTDPDTPSGGHTCPWDGVDHGTSFWGRIVRFFHSILWFFAHLFGLK